MTRQIGAPQLFALCVVTACAAPTAEPKATDSGANATPALPIPIDPSVAGPYAAGTRADDITTETGQPLRVQTWYPASDDADEPIHAYDSLISGEALDAPPPVCARPRPVLLFSHGNQGLRFQSIFLTEHLATRGWIVVAPGHEGNTTFDFDEARWGEVALRRPVDLSQSFDWLVTELAGPGGPLAGCVDPDAGFAVAGHSFGGYTAVAITGGLIERDHAATCSPGWLCDDVAAALGDTASVELTDARAWASVPMTPAAYELLAPSLSAITVPTLVMGGSLDTTTSVDAQVAPIYRGLGATPKHLAVLEEAGHFTFTDACTLLPTYPDCSGDYLDIPTAHRLIRGATTAFLEEQAGLAPAPDGWLPVDDPIVSWESVE